MDEAGSQAFLRVKTFKRFYPSYPVRPATDPKYEFSFSYEACWTAWSQQGNKAYDYGMIWVDIAPGNQLGWLEAGARCCDSGDHQ